MTSPNIEAIFEPRPQSQFVEVSTKNTEALLYQPSTGSYVWHTFKIGAAYSGAILVGLGPNMFVSMMALTGSLINAANTGVAVAKYKWKKHKLKNISDSQPQKKRVLDTLSFLDGELNQIGDGALALLQFAVPVAGPIMVLNSYLNKLNTQSFLKSDSIDFNKREGIKKFVKIISYGLEEGYPNWAYESKEARVANRPSKKLIAKKRTALMREGAVQFKIKTADRRSIEAVYMPGIVGKNEVSREGPTAVIFHGPAQVVDDLKPWIVFYKERGINVLAITIDGYGNNRRVNKLDGFEISQKSIEYDAYAAVDYLLNEVKLPNHHILVHGISTLSVMATFVARHHRDIHLIVDQAATDIEAAALNYISKYVSGKEDEIKSMVMRKISTKLTVVRDIYESEAKSFMAISALQDELMGHGDIETLRFNQYNFSQDLAQAYIAGRMSNKNMGEHIIDFKGVHGDCFTQWKPAVAKMEKHLKSIGFI